MYDRSAYHGTTETTIDFGETPETFWKKGFKIYKHTVRLEGFEETVVHVKHKNLRHLLVKETVIEFDIADAWHSPRDSNSEKYKRADLSYPAILCESNPKTNLEFKYCVLDGHTRVQKALNRGIKKFHGHLIPYEELEKHMLLWSNETQSIISIYEQRQLLGK